MPGLEVHGELPPDLAGAYLRNGPNPRFAPIGSFVYPLDGVKKWLAASLTERGSTVARDSL